MECHRVRPAQLREERINSRKRKGATHYSFTRGYEWDRKNVSVRGMGSDSIIPESTSGENCKNRDRNLEKSRGEIPDSSGLAMMKMDENR